MLVKILSNVSYDSKVLLEGEVYEVDKESANDFIARKIAKLEKAEVVEKGKGKEEKVKEKVEEKNLDLENNQEQD